MRIVSRVNLPSHCAVIMDGKEFSASSLLRLSIVDAYLSSNICTLYLRRLEDGNTLSH